MLSATFRSCRVLATTAQTLRIFTENSLITLYSHLGKILSPTKPSFLTPDNPKSKRHDASFARDMVPIGRRRACSKNKPERFQRQASPLGARKRGRPQGSRKRADFQKPKGLASILGSHVDPTMGKSFLLCSKCP